MSLRLKYISVTPGPSHTCMRFEVATPFDIHDDESLSSLLSNGTPFNMSIDKFSKICEDYCSSPNSPMVIHDSDTDLMRVFNFN